MECFSRMTVHSYMLLADQKYEGVTRILFVAPILRIHFPKYSQSQVKAFTEVSSKDRRQGIDKKNCLSFLHDLTPFFC
jgi:hypothetical protein